MLEHEWEVGIFGALFLEQDIAVHLIFYNCGYGYQYVCKEIQYIHSKKT